MSQGIPLARVGTPTTTQYIPVEPDESATPDRGQFPHTLSLDSSEDVKNIRPLWKRNLYMLLEQPTSSQAAFLVHIFTTALIIISAVVTVLETVPSFHSMPPGMWFGIETSLVALFTVEYIARGLSHSASWKTFIRWFGSFFGIVDLLGIFPYYVEIALQQDTSTFFRFTILRTFRLLRVFRPFRYTNTILLTIEVMYLSFRRSQHALLALSFFVVMVLIVFSTLLYFAERGTWDETIGTFVNSDGDPSQFSSIPAAAWFVLVTITTVGYGEITPRSFLGRLITLPLLVFGLLLIALPTFVLGREFSLVWDYMKEHQHQGSGDMLFDSGFDPLSSPLLQRVRSVTDLRLDAAHADPWRTAPPRMNGRSSEDERDLRTQVSEMKFALDRQEEMLRKIMQSMEGRRKRRVRGHSVDQEEYSAPMS
ncbi:voltage-gated potassium channel [Obba rivulosa]|uniref:Voltage-gated potassium channel n=1 Tax=Obba rivulosa TaxID=1052685 RepID=A0A8E2ARF6_9APHY|nr:voltage-gated potassium channel [Obba rivulosa]